MDYDLIVLDLMLPGMDGTELLRRLRRKGGNGSVPVATARDSTDAKVDDPFSFKLIRTMRGVGYSLREELEN